MKMTRIFFKHLFALMLLVGSLLAPLPGNAADRYNFTYDDKGEMSPDKLYSWSVKIRLFSLLGEPVVSTQFRYHVAPSWTFVSLPALDGSGTYFRTSLSKLPQEAQMLYQAYDVKIAFRFRTGETPSKIVKVISDVGDPGKPDGRTWSFNVPESPDWGEFLMQDNGETYLSSSDAKRAFSSGLTLVDAKVASIKFTSYDLHEWYRRTTIWPQVRAAVTAYNHLADGVERSTGYKTQRKLPRLANSLMNQVRYDDVSGQKKILSSIITDYNKLQNLPAEFLSDENPEPYKVARANSAAIFTKAKASQQNWRSQDLNPASLPKGYPPKGPPSDYKLVETGDGTNPYVKTTVVERSGQRLPGTYSTATTKILSGHFLFYLSSQPYNFHRKFKIDELSMANIAIKDLDTDKIVHDFSRSIIREQNYSTSTPGFTLLRRDEDNKYRSSKKRNVLEGRCLYHSEKFSGIEYVIDSQMEITSSRRAAYDFRYIGTPQKSSYNIKCPDFVKSVTYE